MNHGYYVPGGRICMRQSQILQMLNESMDLPENASYREILNNKPYDYQGDGWSATKERFAAMLRYYIRGEIN